MDVIQTLKEKIIHLGNKFISPPGNKIVDNYYGTPILPAQEGNDLIGQLLTSPEPAMIARLGAFELKCLLINLERKSTGKSGYGASLRDRMANNAGFFPPTDEMLDKFGKLCLEHLQHLDVLAVWFNPGEDYLSHVYCKCARLILPRSLEPYYHERPWSKALRGKKILVIHPYQDSIVSQYTQNRERLFEDPDVLPPFYLDTIKAVQSIAGNRTPFANWFQAYEYMCGEMEKKDFDVAIIGAGAYGLPLAYHAKKLGKKAIQLGGPTQILFGIKGKRWDDHDVISKLYNSYWVRPSADETPSNYKAVEEGCYW
jgi:hypothetical protein